MHRAAETARAITAAQSQSPSTDGGPAPLELVLLPELRERDFGSAEGKKFGAVASSLRGAGAESHEQMRTRAERFVQQRLVRLFVSGQEGSVVVVAHGVILDVLLRVLLARFGPAELARLARAGSRHLVGWSNTGYVEAVVQVRPALAEAKAAEVSGDRTSQQPGPLDRITMSVVGVNVLRHLEGLKKTRGGIGSAQFDKRQRTMDSFFAPSSKKPRVAESAVEPEVVPQNSLPGDAAA